MLTFLTRSLQTHTCLCTCSLSHVAACHTSREEQEQRIGIYYGLLGGLKTDKAEVRIFSSDLRGTENKTAEEVI